MTTLPGHQPTKADVAFARAALQPALLATRPLWQGLEHVPADGPMLLIGNHSQMLGAIDTLLFPLGLYEHTGRIVRGMGDRLHWQVPGWRDLLQRMGAVIGTRENCAALMQAREPVLIYPGGAREVAKRRGERYQLIWGERLGFARMAITHGYPIVPFASIGGDDMYEVVLDADHPVMAPARHATAKLLGGRSDLVMPIGIPKPARLRFWTGQPITPPDATHANDTPAQRALRNTVKASVEHGIAQLLAQRHDDTRAAGAPRRVAHRLGLL
jgi:1-acyl-sn-glycerol-3-phosphate acyltransferase